MFTPCQIFDIINGFWVITQTCNFTICSIFSNSDHVGWCTASPDTILKLDILVMIQTKFGFHWSSTFRGEDFWKSLRRTTDDGRRTDGRTDDRRTDDGRTTDDDDGRQVMAIAHLTLWVRWAKNSEYMLNGQLKTFLFFLATAAILNGGRGCRTQFWKGSTHGPSLPGLV